MTPVPMSPLHPWLSLRRFGPAFVALRGGGFAALLFWGGWAAAADLETMPAPDATKRGRTVAPVAVRRVTPVHPPALRQELVNGEVLLECVVDKEGEVRDVKVINESHPGFAAAAEEALRQWEFQPGTVDGQLAPVRIRVPFEFRLSHQEVLETLTGRPLFEEVKETVIPAAQLPSWPRPKQFYVPRYPPSLAGTGKYGKAVVNITIDKEGKVINPRIVKATYPEFIMPALATAAQLEFPPQVMANNEKVYVNMDIQWDFKVPDGDKAPKSAGPAKEKEKK